MKAESLLRHKDKYIVNVPTRRTSEGALETELQYNLLSQRLGRQRA